MSDKVRAHDLDGIGRRRTARRAMRCPSMLAEAMNCRPSVRFTWASNELPSSLRRFGRLGFLAFASACSAGTEPGETTSVDAAAGTGGGGGTASGDGGRASTNAVTADAVSVGSGGGEGGGCDSFKRQGERKALHLFVVVDRSSSMNGSKWDSTVLGLGEFVDASASEGIDFALHFLPNPGAPTCDAHQYEEPEVGWGALPEISAEISAALDAASPDGQSTPMYPALGGALLATIARVDQSPGDAAAVLLVTDGAPQGPAASCSGVDPESTAAIAQLAENALDRANPVYTFVVGLQGVTLDFADAVAAAGGTDQAFPIAGDNPALAFNDALDTIRSKALPCSYEIPDDLSNPDSGVTIDQVNVEITVGGDESTIPRNDACDGAGWYYDDPAEPTEILLCPESCAELRSDPVGRLDIVLGCSTILN